MSSLSHYTYSKRQELHTNPVAKRLFAVATEKRSNLVISADLTKSEKLIDVIDQVGPHIAVLKTHIDVVEDFSLGLLQKLRDLAREHNFLIFEDRKLVDIGNTALRQYHGGALRLSEWADIVNILVVGGDGIVKGLDQVVRAEGFPFRNERAFIILANMTSEGSLATGEYTKKSVRVARSYPGSVIGFVTTHRLNDVLPEESPKTDEDFIAFSTGINMADRGDSLRQTYQTPEEAVARGADFIIAGRGIYGADDPAATAEKYQKAGWDAYGKRTSGQE